MGRKTHAEDSYFHHVETHHSKKILEKKEKEEELKMRAELKKIHEGHCSECGGTMDVVLFHGRQIKKCSYCRGVFLRGSTLEELCGDDKNFLESFLDLFRIKEEK